MTRSSFEVKIHQLALLCCAGMGLVLAGCGGAAPPAASAARQAGAAKALTAPTTCTGSGAHDEHAAMGIDCAVCHGDGGIYAFGAYAYPGGDSTTGGTILVGSVAGQTTCSVACHAPLGSPIHDVTWGTPGPLDCTACHTTTALVPGHPAVADTATRDTCLACHDQSQHTSGTVRLNSHPAEWMDQGNPGFHAVSANRGLASCEDCHGRDLTGGATGVACGKCHDQAQPDGTVVTWAKNCTMCHGGTDNQTGAPPRTTWGQGGDSVRVGAHTVHVTGSNLAPAFDCELCHVKPADALAAGHIDGDTATVTFAGFALPAGGAAPAWDRAAATCSNTYCHGTATPRWTGGAAEGACGSCHGLPPATAQHPVVGSDLTGCAVCHAKTMDAAGNVIPPSQGGMHLDGMVQATGHDPSWMDQTSTNFHAYAADRGLGPCQACHGQDLSGGAAQVACGSCHDQNLPAGVATWTQNCLMCHGGVDNQTGAPPRATWGNATDPIRVGAHSVHLAGSAVAGPVACTSCHATITDVFSTGHIVSGIAHLTFGGLATAGNTTPSWNRATATCASTYCHGGYSGSYTYDTWDYALDRPVPTTVTYTGGNGAPVWTDGPMTCASCHGNPPSNLGNWHAPSHGGGSDCQICHPDAVGSGGIGTAITNPALHVNGVVDVVPQWKTTCFGCH